MGDDMFAGITVASSPDEKTGVAFLGDELETGSFDDDEALVEVVIDRKPDVIAFDTPFERPREKGFRGAEEEFVDEGRSFLPRSMLDADRIEHAVFLRDMIEKRLETGQYIECRPHLTAETLQISGDKGLEGFGFETAEIRSTVQFDAALAAITAKFYAEGHAEDKGFIVPKEF